MVKKKLNDFKECESCGLSLIKSSDYWTSNTGRIVCNDCMFEPLNVLSKAFFSKDFKSAKKIIMEFDEGFDESFLGVEYV